MNRILFSPIKWVKVCQKQVKVPIMQLASRYPHTEEKSRCALTFNPLLFRQFIQNARGRSFRFFSVLRDATGAFRKLGKSD